MVCCRSICVVDVGEDVADFGGSEEIIDGPDDGARIENAEEGGDEFRAILQPEADAGAGPPAVAAAGRRLMRNPCYLTLQGVEVATP